MILKATTRKIRGISFANYFPSQRKIKIIHHTCHKAGHKHYNYISVSNKYASINEARLDLGLLLNLGQFNVGSGPEVAKVADREVDAQTHLSSHDDEGNVPTQRSDNKQKSTTSLQKC